MINIDHNPLETENGVWAPPFSGVEFLLAHVSNMDFQRKLARLQQPYAKQIERGTLSPDLQRDILCQAMAGTVLRGWRGNMVDQDKNQVPFSEVIAMNLLISRIDIREFVTAFSSNLENFRKEEVEEVGKS